VEPLKALFVKLEENNFNHADIFICMEWHGVHGPAQALNDSEQSSGALLRSLQEMELA
jgi:hypothetical protein